MDLLTVSQSNNGPAKAELVSESDDPGISDTGRTNETIFREAQNKTRTKPIEENRVDPDSSNKNTDVSEIAGKIVELPNAAAQNLLTKVAGRELGISGREAVSLAEEQPVKLAQKPMMTSAEKNTHGQLHSMADEIDVRRELNGIGDQRVKFEQSNAREEHKVTRLGNFIPLHENASLPISGTNVTAITLSADVDGTTLNDSDIKNIPQIDALTEKVSFHGNHVVRHVNPGAPAAQTSAAMQVAASLNRADGTEEIEIRLDPPDLGKVKISFVTTGVDAIRGVLSAEHGQILDHLRKHADELTRALENAGFDKIDLQFTENNRDQKFFDETVDFSGEAELAEEVMPEKAVTYLQIKDGASMDVRV